MSKPNAFRIRHVEAAVKATGLKGPRAFEFRERLLEFGAALEQKRRQRASVSIRGNMDQSSRNEERLAAAELGLRNSVSHINPENRRLLERTLAEISRRAEKVRDNVRMAACIGVAASSLAFTFSALAMLPTHASATQDISYMVLGTIMAASAKLGIASAYIFKKFRESADKAAELVESVTRAAQDQQHAQRPKAG